MSIAVSPCPHCNQYHRVDQIYCNPDTKSEYTEQSILNKVNKLTKEDQTRLIEAIRKIPKEGLTSKINKDKAISIKKNKKASK